MKNFNFKLQSLLQLRNQIREQLFHNWAASTQALQRAQQEKERLKTQIDSWQTTYRTSQGNGMSGKDFWREQQAAAVLQHHWLEQDRLKQHLESRTKQAFQAWQEARKKEDILERLKERAKKDWLKDFERHEQKLSDERASLKSNQQYINNMQSLRQEAA
jgi:flagellar FliJ protein